MGSAIPTHIESDLQEPNYVPVIHCDGAGPIHVENGSLHIILWQEQLSLDGSRMDRIVVGRVVSRVDRAQVSVGEILMAMRQVATL